MRNYDFEIEELTEDIKELEVEKRKKERRLNQLLMGKESTGAENTSRTLKDLFGKPITVRDWVKVVTKGKFNSTEGEVTKITKWVTFLDSHGIKQVRAPHNLIVVEDVRSVSGTSSSRRGRKPQSNTTLKKRK